MSNLTCVRALAVESPQGREPLGRGGKKRACKLFLPALRPRRARGLGTEPTPSVAEGARLKN